MVEIARRNHPELTFVVADAEEEDAFSQLEGTFDYIVLSDTVGYLDDIERVFRAIRRISAPHTRLVVSYYSHLWEPVLPWPKPLARNTATRRISSSTDITNLLYMAGFEVVRTEWRQLIPRLLGLGSHQSVIGTCLIVPSASLYSRASIRKAVHWQPSVSFGPCRNDNIESAITRMPRLAKIWKSSMSRATRAMAHSRSVNGSGTLMPVVEIRVAQQEGRGGDAVRKGFEMARKDILIILDADLTVAGGFAEILSSDIRGHGRIYQRHPFGLSDGAGRHAVLELLGEPHSP